MDFFVYGKKDDDVRMECQHKKEIPYHLVGTERKVDGHTLFSYNTLTGEIKVADVIVCRDVDFVTRLPLHKPKIVIEPNCVYRQALNRKNFVKRLVRDGVMCHCEKKMMT